MKNRLNSFLSLESNNFKDSWQIFIPGNIYSLFLPEIFRIKSGFSWEGVYVNIAYAETGILLDNDYLIIN